MKKYIIPTLCTLVLTVGCGKKQTTPTANTNPAPDNSAPGGSAAAPLAPPAKPLAAPQPNVPSTTSFAAVTKHLDAGGDFYLYWNANQLQDFAQDGLEKIEALLKDEMPREMHGEAEMYMKLAKAAYIESGLESIDGFGASSFRTGTGLRRHKVMIHHNPAKGDGLMWKALGTAPHELGGLKLMPATTAYAVHADLDVAGTFKWIKGFIASNLPAKQGAMLAELLEEANAEVPIEKIINSTGGEVGVYFTLNPDKMIELDPEMLRMFGLGGGRVEPPWDMEEEMPTDEAESEDEGEPGPTDGPATSEEFDPSNGEVPLRNRERKLQSGDGPGKVAALAELPRGIPGVPLGPEGFGGGEPDMPKIKIPEPGLVLVLKVKDNTITNLLDPLLKLAGTTAQQVDDVTMHTIPVPAEESPIDLSPTFLQVGEYLVITSTLDLAKQVVAVQSGKAAGLAGTAEFKKLTNGLDLKANMITYTSNQLGESLRKILDLGMQEEFRREPKIVTDTMAELYSMPLKSQVTLLSVTGEGYLIQNQTTGHIPMDPAVVAAIAVVPVAVAAAAAAPSALPALAQAKARANRIKSLNNLSQINRALRAYAENNGGKLPAADKWCDAIMREVQAPILFVSPSDPEAKAKFERGEKVCSYAFNAALAGKSLFEIDHNVVLVFECNLGWNGTGGLADLRKNVPPDQWIISLINGSSRQTNPNWMQRNQVQWKSRIR